MGKKKLQGADGMNFQLQLTIKGLESINLPEENLTNESGNDIMKISCWGGKLSAYVNLPRLVYMAHIGVIPEGMQINHKDENKVNNCIDNLELMTNKENCSYGTRNARISKSMKRYRAKQRAMAAC